MSKKNKQAEAPGPKKQKVKRKATGRPFQKGHNRPGPGRPRLTELQKFMRGQYKEEFLAHLAKYWGMSVDDTLEKTENKALPNSEMMFARWFTSRMDNPTNEDMRFLAKLLGIDLDRMTINHVSEDGSMSPQHNISDEQKRAMCEAYLEQEKLKESESK